MSKEQSYLTLEDINLDTKLGYYRPKEYWLKNQMYLDIPLRDYYKLFLKSLVGKDLSGIEELNIASKARGKAKPRAKQISANIEELSYTNQNDCIEVEGYYFGLCFQAVEKLYFIKRLAQFVGYTANDVKIALVEDKESSYLS